MTKTVKVFLRHYTRVQTSKINGFEEAQSVFFDENAIEFFDPDHSETENRFLLLGLSYRLRILLVCYCLRESENMIRIISARKATKKEQKEYTGGK